MKLTVLKTFVTCLLYTSYIICAYGNNDGLYFNSYSYTPANRTTLLLNNGNKIGIKDGFRMSFSMDLRTGEPFFGNIFCIKTDDGKHIDAILSMPAEGVNKPVLVVDGKLNYINYDVKARNNIKVEITLDKQNGRIVYVFGEKKTIVQTSLANTSAATILFGMHPNDNNYVDVAPMNVRDIAISYDGKNKYFWDLRQHEESVCHDNISNAPATATTGHWILDNHVQWKTRFTYNSKEKVQVTYNPKENIFYIVDSKTVRCYDPARNTTKTVSVKGGHRAMMYSNYIGYSASGMGLFTYNIKDNLVSKFDFTTGRWSNDQFIANEPGGFNHSWAIVGDTVAYAFGGYGFYKYKNCLWRINLKSGEMKQLDYSPKINPRTGSASVVVGDKLYIFGGYGNETGEQELPCKYYYDLLCIDLKTMKAETLWTTEGAQQGTSFLLSSEMLFNSKDSTFYVATTYKSGRLLKMSMKEPGWKIVTESIDGEFGYKDMTFNLYRSERDGKIYVVMNRRMNNLSHNVRIVSIDLPVQDDYMPKDIREMEEKGTSWWWLLLIIPIAGVPFVMCRSKAKAQGQAQNTSDTSAGVEADNANRAEDDNGMAVGDTAGDNKIVVYEEEEQEKTEPAVRYYNPEGGYISLLGKFLIRDRNGEDITSLFTRRTRNLLLMLLLHSERKGNGIEIHLLDETLWQEMDDESARNNRNVYMRKLRVLLEKIGKIEVVNDKIHYRIRLGKDVFFDYHEVLTMMNRMEEDDSEETTARTLELLFEGPLLPNYSFEWLDKFKADYSNDVISLLTRQLRRVMQNGNDNMAMKIAETIMMHDPFSDNALATQCAILCRRHKKGIAKNVYDNFCKNYETCIGEKYHLSFAEVCK